MTDKQIIIDGIDVSECKHFENADQEMCCELTCCGGCRGINCYYKQLKAKEQECERTKERLESFQKDYSKLYQVVENKGYIKELDQLKAENDELKVMFKDLSYENQKFSYQIEEQTKQLEPFKDEYFKGLDNVVIAELAKKSIRITAENRKLEQTLIEIKEIARVGAFYWKHYKEESKRYNEILQKISECEGNNEYS